MPCYTIFAGVNGAGKSTLYLTTSSIQNDNRVNTDEIISTIGNWRNAEDNIKAGKIAVSKIKEYFRNMESFNQETTLCGRSILANIRKAKELGYRIEMYYVGVTSVEIAKSRVRQRVLSGGHGVSEKDIERRYCQSFENLKSILSFCDIAVLYDNTDFFKKIAVFYNGDCKDHAIDIPEWARQFIL